MPCGLVLTSSTVVWTHPEVHWCVLILMTSRKRNTRKQNAKEKPLCIYCMWRKEQENTWDWDIFEPWQQAVAQSSSVSLYLGTGPWNSSKIEIFFQMFHTWGKRKTTKISLVSVQLSFCQNQKVSPHFENQSWMPYPQWKLTFKLNLPSNQSSSGRVSLSN